MQQRRCDTITGMTSCIVPNTKTKKLKAWKTPFTYFLMNNNIMNIIIDHRNNRINETIICLQRGESYNK